jgi:hypothetical protein
VKAWLMPMMACGLFLACDRHASRDEGTARSPEAVPASEMLLREFPLLPVAEKKRWARLQEAEAVRPVTNESREQVDELVEELRRLHPFSSDAAGFELGGIRYDATGRTFRLPARVCYPDEGDERHPGELEVMLCTERGRVHETLFVTEVRPLHLELLLHLAGYRKGVSRFTARIVPASGEPVAVREMVRRMDGREWTGPVEWEFSGSGFDDLYAPDLSGDFAIFWHAHDSVLRVADEEIGAGMVKLKPVRHPALANGDSVALEFTAVAREPR